MSTLIQPFEPFDQPDTTHSLPKQSMNSTLTGSVIDPADPSKPSLTSRTSSSTLRNNRLSNISTISEQYSPYSTSLNGSSASVVDPRSLGYFQNSPVVRRNSSSVPNLVINVKPLEKPILTAHELRQPQGDFDFSSEASSSRRSSVVPFKHSTPSVNTVKSVRYTPSHKKSFSIHDTTNELVSSQTSLNTKTPPVSPTATKFDLDSRAHPSKLASYKSTSTPHLGSSMIPRKIPSSGSAAAFEASQSSIPRPKAKVDHVSRSSDHSHPEPPNQAPSSHTSFQSSNGSISNMPLSEPSRPTGFANSNSNQDNNNNRPSSNDEPLPNPDAPSGYPFLRALHSFDAASLSTDIESEENPASICLSFQESEIVLLHTIHQSGWGDATILSNGVRGWIPTNYFTPYTDSKITPLLSAVLGFVLNPRSQPVSDEPRSTEPPAEAEDLTFSQSAVTNIVAGVRSLLESCGTLTRDTQIVRRSQSIRKFRKILLAELAILVSLAKQYKNTTDDANIERLVTGSYKIISRAVVFLDIWTIDTSNPPTQTEEHTLQESFQNGTPSIDNLHTAFNQRSDIPLTAYNQTPAFNGGIETIHEQTGSDTEDSQKVTVNPIPARTNRSANRESVIFHQQPPYARQRLDEVNDALTSYLGNFIHRMTVLETDPTACTQILVNTRKSMLACRELLAAVESISSRSLPRNKDLENCKDRLFAQIRNLVTAARDVVATTPAGDMMKRVQDDEDAEAIQRPSAPSGDSTGPCSPEGQRLIDIATDCARISGECVVRCRHILEKIGDFQLATNREYPDFSDGIIAVSNGRQRTSLIIPHGTAAADPSPSSSTFSPYGSNEESEPLASPVSPVVPLPYGRRSSQTAPASSSRNLEEAKQSNGLPSIPALSPLINGESDPNVAGMGSIDTALDPLYPTSVDGYDETRHYGNLSRIPAVMEEDDTQLDEEDQRLPMSLLAEDQIIIDDNGRVRGGSLDALVKVLTDEHVEQDATYVSTFFTTFRQFTNSIDLAETLVRRYASELDKTEMDSEDIEALVTRRTKVYNVFKRWMESHWKHSVDVVVLPQIVNFANSQVLDIPNAQAVLNDLAGRVQQMVDGEPILARSIAIPGGNSARMAAITYSHSPLVSSTVSRQLSMLLVKAIDQNHQAEEEEDTKLTQTTSNSNSTWSTPLRIVKNNAGPQLTILDIDPADIAKQLCLIDSNLFCRIKPEELLDLNFSAKRRHLGLAVNVNEMTVNANQLSAFVGDSILSGDFQPKTRRNVLKQWIKIAEKCHEMRNLNSLMTIVSALQSVNIMRLKKTWELLSPRYHVMFNELKAVVAVDKNYASYRAVLRNHEIPTIPYLGLYLTDLTFVNEGNSTHRLLAVDSEGKVIPPGRRPPASNANKAASMMVINFDRHERTTRIIGEVQNFQVPYRVMATPELQKWLQSEMRKSFASVSKDQNNLWRRSCIVEPKET